MTPYLEPMASAYQANKSRRPQAAIKAGLFDHLVGAGEQRGWHSRPTALAVVRLITSSYLTGACTGRLALNGQENIWQFT